MLLPISDSQRAEPYAQGRKTEHPGFVETPGAFRKTRSRKSNTPEVKEAHPDVVSTFSEPLEDHVKVPTASTHGNFNGSTLANSSAKASGTVNGGSTATRKIDGCAEGKDPRVDYSGHFEFGGSLGVSAMMLGFPCLMYYMWVGATYYDGHLPLPAEGQSALNFFQQMVKLVYEGAFPTARAWAIYWTFFIFEAVCYIHLPGVTIKGKRLLHEGGKQLTYHCSGIWSFAVTIVVMGSLHLTGAFKLYTIIDEFGPLMSVAIISGFLVSFVAYTSALYRGAEHRMSGYPIYDFFMGAELNPRMFGILDFKMFFEVRIPWYILFMISCGAAARQYEQFGWVSGEMMFLVMAHFLYANACSKAEECIVTTW